MTLRDLTPFVLCLALAACGGSEPETDQNLPSAENVAGIDSDQQKPDAEAPDAETPDDGAVTDETTGEQDRPLIGDPNLPGVSEDSLTEDPPQPYTRVENVDAPQGEGEQGEGETGGNTEEPEPTVTAGPGNNQPAATGDPILDEIVAAIRAAEIDVESENWRVKVPTPPEVEYAGDTKYEWYLVTNQGPLTIRLLPQVAPKHVTSTAYLSMLGFYDGLTFHRVIDGFMAQGGDPLGSGLGGPAYNYDPELVRGVNHTGRGVLSMANAGPGTDGSQFFITFASRPDLDRLQQHTIFGRVTSGWETLDKIEALADPKAPNGVPPKETIVIESATVRVVADE